MGLACISSGKSATAPYVTLFSLCYNECMEYVSINLYGDKGWIDWPSVYATPYAWIIMTGGRAIGKTYGAIRFLAERGIPFIFFRRTEAESVIQNDPMLSDLSLPLKEAGIDFYVERIKRTKLSFWKRSDNNEIICMNAAMRTFGKIRGVNYSWADAMLFDEFIPKPEEPRYKKEGFNLQQAYESVNRNRELDGKPPVRLICLSNSLNLQNDVFMELNLIDDADELSQDPTHECAAVGDRLLIINKFSPISEKKKETVLYRNASEDFYKMAIENQFILNDRTYVKKRPLKEYSAVCSVGSMFFYKHKSNGTYYVCGSRANVKETYSTESSGVEKFRRKHWRWWTRYLDGKFYFSSYKYISLFERLFN